MHDYAQQGDGLDVVRGGNTKMRALDLLKWFYLIIWELTTGICVILDYNFLHLNEYFADLLSWIISHKIVWFWESRVNLPNISGES